MKSVIPSKSIILIGFISVFISCKQEKDVQPSPTQQAIITVTEARQWFETNLSTATGTSLLSGKSKRVILWEYAQERKFSDGNPVIVAPLVYTDGQWSAVVSDKDQPTTSKLDKTEAQEAKLILFKNPQNQIQAQIVRVLPDASYRYSSNSKDYSGLLMTYDWNDQFTKGYRYREGNLVSILSPLEAKARTDWTICTEITTSYWYTACVTVSDGEHCETHFSFSEIAMECIVVGLGGGGEGIGIPTPGTIGVGGGIGGSSSSDNVVVYGPDDPIADLQDYLNCFTISTASNYKITVNVDQAIAGTRVNFNKEASSPGHTYLTLEQYNSEGSQIIRNVGFYPQNSVGPFSPVSAPAFNNDKRSIDVSLSVYVTGNQFNTVLNYLTTTANAKDYDLNNYNCTDMCLATLAQAGIPLPDTYGAWLNGGGSNPGDLGEDIRTMPLEPNMTRNTTSGNPPANKGICQTE